MKPNKKTSNGDTLKADYAYYEPGNMVNMRMRNTQYKFKQKNPNPPPTLIHHQHHTFLIIQDLGPRKVFLTLLKIEIIFLIYI